MKFFKTRNFMTAGLISLVLGGISLTTGYFMGGIKVQDGYLTTATVKKITKTQKFSSTIDKIKINSEAVQVKIQLGDEFSVQSELPTGLTLQATVTGNTLSLDTRSRSQHPFFNLSLFSSQLSGKFIVTLPKRDQLKSLDIESDAASTTLSDLKLNSLSLTANASPVKLSNLEVGQLKASADASSFKMSKISATSLDFEGNAAELNFKQLSLKNSGKISLDAGSLTLSQYQFPGLKVTGDATSLSVNGKGTKFPYTEGDESVKIALNAASIKIEK
ncbi:MAG: DUF4097 domain-containing protein [Streptococcaceae bacterium]|jgi:hypothetical protein|nr:DUF4097 domain-containing protein [Streptococcaceae bacterium]